MALLKSIECGDFFENTGRSYVIPPGIIPDLLWKENHRFGGAESQTGTGP